MSNYKNEIVLVFDKEALGQYTKYYFKMKPRSRKAPITDPIPPSLNQFIVKQRPAQNTIKQNWKMFAMHVASQYRDLNITECEIDLQFTFKDKRRRDLDNYISTSLKLIQDGLSAEEGIGVFIDDSYTVIKKVTAQATYEKGVSKLVFTIRY